MMRPDHLLCHHLGVPLSKVMKKTELGHQEGLMLFLSMQLLSSFLIALKNVQVLIKKTRRGWCPRTGGGKW